MVFSDISLNNSNSGDILLYGVIQRIILLEKSVKDSLYEESNDGNDNS